MPKVRPQATKQEWTSHQNDLQTVKFYSATLKATYKELQNAFSTENLRNRIDNKLQSNNDKIKIKFNARQDGCVFYIVICTWTNFKFATLVHLLEETWPGDDTILGHLPDYQSINSDRKKK